MGNKLIVDEDEFMKWYNEAVRVCGCLKDDAYKRGIHDGLRRVKVEVYDLDRREQHDRRIKERLQENSNKNA